MALSTNLVSGLASGFDWRTMIDQLMALERRPVDVVEAQKSEYEARLSEWQSFNTKLLSLKTAAAGISDPDNFYLYTARTTTDSATVDGEDLIAISTSTSAAPGTYTIKATNLAKAQKLASNPFAGQTTALGASYAGDIIINGKLATINAADSLADVAATINGLNTGSEPSGVTATVVNYGTNDYRLILTSDATGQDGIGLLNGGSDFLVQKFGWKDKDTSTDLLKNEITNGAQSDLFSNANEIIESLLGLSAGGESGTIQINGTNVAIDLSSMSMSDIKNAINSAMSAAGKDIVASVVSQTVSGTDYYRLQIEGTPNGIDDFTDANNILNTLGIVDYASAAVSGKVSQNTMTADGVYITPETLLTEIDGYISYDAADNIHFGGTKNGGEAVDYTFSIDTATTVADLLDAIETRYASVAGDVVASITADGKIRVDDVAGGGGLNVTLTDSIAHGELEFVDSDLAFGAAASRQREIVAGEDATIEVDGIEVTNSDNIIANVIGGVKLNLLNEDAGTTITLHIERDIDSVKGKITDFVASYNDVMTYINGQFTYNQEAEEPGGVLFGDGTLSSVKSDMASLLTQSIWGVDNDFTIMGLVGITLDNELLLSINDSKLNGYLQTNFNDVMSLFVAQGTTSNSTLSYINHSRDSQAGEYTVHITQAATQSTSTSNTAVSGVLGADETLTITEAGKIASISLTSSMSISDIVNAVNTELDAVYTQRLIGDTAVQSGGSAITSATNWADIDGGQLVDGDIIAFSGTTRGGASVSGAYTLDNASSDAVQGLLSAVESAFGSDVNASIDSTGHIVITDRQTGDSHLAFSLDYSQTQNGVDIFGSVLATNTGGQEGRYALDIEAANDGSDHLILTHEDYGSNYSFSISETADLLWTGGDTTVANGVDVAGTINGEASTGSGRVLTGNDGNVNTDGLSIMYAGAAADADVGTVKLTLGIAELFDRTLFGMTDAFEGYVAFKQDSLQDNIQRLGKDIEDMEMRLDLKMERMINKFVAMEVALSKIQSQSSWLNGQLNAIYSGWV